MPLVNKIDSNVTSFAYAQEQSLGVLPGSPSWKRVLPNSYSDFGGSVTSVTSNPINPSRQKKKGVVSDLDVTGGFNANLNFYSLQDFFSAFMFADFRRKGSVRVTAVDLDAGNPDEYEVSSTTGFLVGSLIKGFNFSNAANNALNTVTVVTANTSVEVANGLLVAEASPPTTAYIQTVGHIGAAGDLDIDSSLDLPALTSTTLNFTTLGLVVGQWVFIGGDAAGTKFSNSANNGFKRIRSISQNRLVFDKSVSEMVTEASTAETIHIYFGDVLRNESGSSIIRKSFNLERTLGASDSASPGQIQSEHIKGAVVNEVTINVPTSNIATVDLNFVGIDHLQRTGSQGVLQSSVTSPQASEDVNTTSDISRIRLATVTNTAEAPTPLFAYITEATINISNNVTPNKAVGVFGAFDITAGQFTVGGSMTTYFSTVAAVSAVRDNASLTLDMAFVKNNQGIVLDIPLITLGEGRLNVEQDQPIMLPLSMEAATAEELGTGFDHTLLFTFFGYLPNLAN